MHRVLCLCFALLTACSSAPAPAAGKASAPDARTALAATVAAMPANRHDRPGFKALEADGRLTVFRTDDPQLAAFARSGELGKSVTRVGAGPDGMTLRAPDADTLAGWQLARPGFATRMQDGRLWVFSVPSKEWDEFQQSGTLQKHITRIGAGPDGITVKAADGAVIDGWLAAH